MFLAYFDLLNSTMCSRKENTPVKRQSRHINSVSLHWWEEQPLSSLKTSCLCSSLPNWIKHWSTRVESWANAIWQRKGKHESVLQANIVIYFQTVNTQRNNEFVFTVLIFPFTSLCSSFISLPLFCLSQSFLYFHKTHSFEYFFKVFIQDFCPMRFILKLNCSFVTNDLCWH